MKIRHFVIQWTYSDRYWTGGRHRGQCSIPTRGGDQLLRVEFDRCPHQSVSRVLELKMSSVTEKLIEIVKLHGVIFDLSHPDYKNIRNKSKIWEEIGRSLGEDGDDMKKKWKNLRDSYAKHLRAEKSHIGQPPKSIDRYKTWPWAQQMAFFRPFLQFGSTNSNISTVDSVLDSPDESENSREGLFVSKDRADEYGFLQQAVEMPTQPQPAQESPCRQAPIANNRKRKHHEETLSQPSAVERVLAYLENKNVDQNFSYEDIDLIFLGYAKTIKKFSPRRQTIVKFKMAQLLMEEELAQQMDDESKNTFSH
uniref:(California timema) hypothetical protein n=1 Tax=Timema californicum TaxID=61474 RepID=A0A7R9JI91_TIMCA|nr:unnamed protein product [Timema californicum]